MLKQSAYFLASIIVLLTIFIVVERTSSPFFQSCISDQQDAQADASGKNKPSGYGAVFTSYVACSGRFIEGHGVGITALATIIIAAFTGTLWFATSEQAQMTREALVADKRAFVFATNFEQFWEIDAVTGYYGWRFRPVWRNSGDTPTKGLTLHVVCELRNTPLPPDFDMEYPNDAARGGLLGPKSDSPGGMAPMIPLAPISAQDIKDVEDSRKFLYLIGWTRYWDVFPGTAQHITRFCWQIFPAGDPFAFIPKDADHTLGFPYVHHSKGNCADEECATS